MDFLDMLNSLYYKRLNEENLEIQMKKITELININLKEIIDSSFKKGFEEGEKYARNDENLNIRARITSKLFSNTTMTDEEIFQVVGFDEEKWKENIAYFRKQYEDGKKSSMLMCIYIDIKEKFGELSEEIKYSIKKLDCNDLKYIIKAIDDCKTIQEFKCILQKQSDTSRN